MLVHVYHKVHEDFHVSFVMCDNKAHRIFHVLSGCFSVSLQVPPWCLNTDRDYFKYR